MKIYGFKSSSFHANWPSFNEKKKHCYCIYTDRKISTISCNRNTILCLTTLSHALDKAVILHQQSEFTHQFMPRLGGSMSRPHD